MLVRAGNSIDVLQELRKLVASHLTKCTVPPAKLPTQDAPHVPPMPTVQSEQEDGSIPVQLHCTSSPSQNQSCPSGHDEPMCDANLLAHLVDNHSGLLFCPYKDCTFGSVHQSGIDSHIIQMHQVYQNDQSNADSNPAEVDSQDESDVWSEPLCSSPNADSPERLDDIPTADACPYDKAIADQVQYEGSTEHAMDDVKITLHFCSKCSLYFSTAARYIQHMTLAHMVDFFCGYCLKAYKKSRCLFLHTGCEHPGQMLSVKCFRDEKVVDVGQQVQPLWIEDARQYLQKVQTKLFGVRGRGMVQKLKNTIASMASVCSDPEVGLREYTATHDRVADHPRQVPATQLPSTLCTAQRTGLRHMKEQTAEHSLQGQPWSSRVPCEKYVIEEHFSGHFSAYKGPAADSVKHHPDISRNSLPSEPPFTATLSRKLNLKVRASAYVDPRYCKRVDGKIVVDELVWQNLLMLSAANRPISKGSLQEGPLDGNELGEKCHQCFKCSLHFASFEKLGQHIVLHHRDRVANRRFTGTLLRGKSQHLAQGFPSNISEDIKPFAAASSWLNSSVQAESSTSDPSCKEVQLKTRECSNDDSQLFVRLVSGNILSFMPWRSEKSPAAQESLDLDCARSVNLKSLQNSVLMHGSCGLRRLVCILSQTYRFAYYCVHLFLLPSCSSGDKNLKQVSQNEATDEKKSASTLVRDTVDLSDDDIVPPTQRHDIQTPVFSKCAFSAAPRSLRTRSSPLKHPPKGPSARLGLTLRPPKRKFEDDVDSCATVAAKPLSSIQTSNTLSSSKTLLHSPQVFKRKENIPWKEPPVPLEKSEEKQTAKEAHASVAVVDDVTWFDLDSSKDLDFGDDWGMDDIGLKHESDDINRFLQLVLLVPVGVLTAPSQIISIYVEVNVGGQVFEDYVKTS
ncbi:hypothetical protein HPB48_011036 [Haemaphysalis longicornis]|uniref:C2H2-type domain-containing protein n=1 Tax=Haemaphysalis longicornis TaxID=44386 RepID=A0A9J6GRI2_HAELO|nr:hypothetical protein HPB48_011036 [Haemaphysalis longicornis]